MATTNPHLITPTVFDPNSFRPCVGSGKMLSNIEIIGVLKKDYPAFYKKWKETIENTLYSPSMLLKLSSTTFSYQKEYPIGRYGEPISFPKDIFFLIETYITIPGQIPIINRNINRYTINKYITYELFSKDSSVYTNNIQNLSSYLKKCS